MKHNFTKHLKESCRKNSDEQFSFKYFLNIALSTKQSGDFVCYRHEWVKKLTNVYHDFRKNVLHVWWKSERHDIHSVMKNVKLVLSFP